MNDNHNLLSRLEWVSTRLKSLRENRNANDEDEVWSELESILEFYEFDSSGIARHVIFVYKRGELNDKGHQFYFVPGNVMSMIIDEIESEIMIISQKE